MAAVRSNQVGDDIQLQKSRHRRVSLSCDGRVEGEAMDAAEAMSIKIHEAPAKMMPCPVAVPTVSPNATDDEVDDAASARSATAARPVIREFFEGPSMFYNDGLNPLLPDRSEEPQRKRRRIKPGPVKVGSPDPHARFVALLWGPRKRL